MHIGVWEIVVVLMIVLIVFGAGKLPQVMGDFAKGIKQFKAGLADTTDQPASTGAGVGDGAAPAAIRADVPPVRPATTVS